MRIGFVSDINPYTDKTSWSGTVYKLRESIEKSGYEVVWVKFDKKFDDFYSKIGLNLISWYIKYSQKNVIGTCYLGFFCRYFAKTIEQDGTYKTCDCLFFAGPSGGQIALYLKEKIPYIYLADANYHLMENYYWFNLSPYFARKAKKEEELATQKAWINIRSSKWAADGAIRDCHADEKNVFILEFGPNIEQHDITIVPSYTGGQLNLIFSGTDWVRKGGQTAVETTQILRNMGYDAVLHIVGIKELPAQYQNLAYIKNIGFLNKTNPTDYKKYIDMWRTAHLLLLPTRAECSAIVYSEAAAYGIPVFTYNTGGAGNYVIDGLNGYKLDLSEGATCFAQKIHISIEQDEMQVLARGAQEIYRSTLSWERWSERFRTIIESKKHEISAI